MMRFRLFLLTCLIAVLALAPGAGAQGVRIKDITDVEGARGNQLYGFGLVVGLNGTGSRSPFTQQVAVDMLQKLSVVSKIIQEAQNDNQFKSSNISAVMVTAEIGPFARCGSRIDVTVSVLDDATSLQGGTLLLTPLRGADCEVYAVAQGPLSVGGFSFSGQAASATKNHPNVGRIPAGAFVEREVPGEIYCRGQVHLLLRDPDYLTARCIMDAVGKRFPYSAVAVNAGAVHVFVPPERRGDLVAFVSEIGVLEVCIDMQARVVINERTGTIVAGEKVKLSTMAIAHGNLAIITSEEPEVSQPNPFGRGRTVVVPRTNLGVSEQPGALNVVNRTITVADLARALNALGVSPRDLIAIFQAIKQAGGLHAELVIM
jgi:flagellar P-ring protein precursor FlgI